MMRHAQSRHAAIPDDDDDDVLTDDGTMCQYPGGGVPHNVCRPPRSLWRGGYTSVGWICPEPTVDDDVQLAGPSTAGGSGGSSGSGGGGGDGGSTAVEPSLIRSDLEPAQAQASPSNHSLSKSDETPRGQGCQTAPPPPQTDGARVVPAVPGQSRPSTTAGVHQPPLVQQKSESSTGPTGLSGLSVGPGAPSTTRERRRSENALDALLDELQTFSPRSADSPSKRCLPVTEAIIGTGNSVGLSGDNRSKSTSALPLGASVATPAASSGNNSCTNSNSAAAVNGSSSSASSKEVGAKKTPPPPPPRTTSKSPVQSPTGTGASSSTSVTNISVNSNNNSSSSSSNNNGNNENNNNNNSSSSSTSSSGNNNSNNSAQQQQQQQQQQTARRCQSEPPSIRKISEQNSSGSSESVNSQEGTQNRQEMLEQRHQELLKKQKLLQEQYARLQLLQKLSPPKPDLKKTGSESNILHKASAHGASGICASHTSGSLTSLAASAGGPSNKITSSPSQPQLATSTSRNKIYETDIL